MAQSLAKILIHVIFSTKNRQPIIPADLAARLSAYLAGGLKTLACPGILVTHLEFPGPRGFRELARRAKVFCRGRQPPVGAPSSQSPGGAKEAWELTSLLPSFALRAL